MNTVYVKSENKGLRVLVGLVVAIIWARYWWFGSLYEALIPHYAQTKECASTGTLLELAVNLLWGLGTVVIGLLSMGRIVVTDLVSGVSEFVKRRWIRDGSQPQPASSSPSPTRVIDTEKLVATLQSHEARLNELEKPPKIPYRRVTRQSKPKGK